MTDARSDASDAPATWLGLRVGPLLMVLAGLSFTLMVSLVKVARAELSALDVVFWRGAVAMPVIGLLALRHPLRPRRPGLLLLRASLGFAAMYCYFTAAKGLAITDQTLLGKLQPIVIAALAPVLLGRGEGAGLAGWGLIGLGLAGSAVLIAPELQVGSVYGLYALAATVFSGLAHLAIRKLTATDPPAIIVLWFQAFVTVVAGALLLGTGGFALPPPHLWAPLAGVGLLAVVGQILMTYAYRADRAPLVAAAGYTTPLWAVMVDLVAWGVVPGWHAMAGGLLVVLAGLGLVFRRQDPQPPARSADGGDAGPSADGGEANGARATGTSGP